MYLHSSNEEYSNVPTKQWQVQQCTNTAVTRLFCWYFEPSQPQRITSGLKQTSICLPIYYAHKSSNHKLSINHKISHDTNLHKTKQTQTSDKIFQELVPSVSPLLKEHIRLGHAGIVDHSVDLSIPDFKKVKKRKEKKEWTEAIQNNNKNYINA